MAKSRLMVQWPSTLGLPKARAAITTTLRGRDDHDVAIAEIGMLGALAVSATCMAEEPTWRDWLGDFITLSEDQQAARIRDAQARMVIRVGEQRGGLGEKYTRARGYQLLFDIEVNTVPHLAIRWPISPKTETMVEGFVIAVSHVLDRHQGDRAFRNAALHVVSQAISNANAGRVGPSNAARFVEQALADDPYADGVIEAADPAHTPLTFHVGERQPVSLHRSPGTSGYAIASLILSLVLGPFGWAASIITGHIAARQLPHLQEPEGRSLHQPRSRRGLPRLHPRRTDDQVVARLSRPATRRPFHGPAARGPWLRRGRAGVPPLPGRSREGDRHDGARPAIRHRRQGPLLLGQLRMERREGDHAGRSIPEAEREFARDGPADRPLRRTRCPLLSPLHCVGY